MTKIPTVWYFSPPSVSRQILSIIFLSNSGNTSWLHIRTNFSVQIKTFSSNSNKERTVSLTEEGYKVQYRAKWIENWPQIKNNAKKYNQSAEFRIETTRHGLTKEATRFQIEKIINHDSGHLPKEIYLTKRSQDFTVKTKQDTNLLQ